MAGLSQPYFELEFRPNDQLVSVVRKFISEFYERVLRVEPDVTSRIALATHELLDNAASYSTDGATRLTIAVAPLARETARLTIRISNHANPDAIESIRGALEAMSRGTDPFAHFQGEMRNVAHAKASGSGPAFGLARVWAEADMALACEVQGSYICIVAQ